MIPKAFIFIQSNSIAAIVNLNYQETLRMIKDISNINQKKPSGLVS